MRRALFFCLILALTAIPSWGALLSGDFVGCRTLDEAVASNGSTLTLLDGRIFPVPPELTPPSAFTIRHAPSSEYIVSTTTGGGGCSPSDARVLAHRIVGAGLGFVGSHCIPGGIAFHCLFEDAAASPQQILAIAETSAPGEPQALHWIDLATNLRSINPALQRSIDFVRFGFGPSGTVALVPHDLADPNGLDWSVVDLCPGRLGTIGTTFADRGPAVTAAVVETAPATWVARLADGGIPFADLPLDDCLSPEEPTDGSLTITIDGQGTVVDSSGAIECEAPPGPGGTCAAIYPVGTEVELEAFAAPGFVFSGWGDGCVGSGFATTIEITGDHVCSATFVDHRANLSIAAPALASGTPGLPVDLALTVGNTGPATAGNVGLAVALPNGVDFTTVGSTPGCTLQPGSPRSVRCTLGDLPAGHQRAVVLRFPLDPWSRATVLLDSNLSSTSIDPDLSDNATSTALALVPEADLRLTKTGPASVEPGGIAVWTIEVTNQGPSAVLDLGLRDELPSGLTAVGGEPGVELSCSGGSSAPEGLAPGGRATMRVVTQVDAELPIATVLENRAFLLAAEADPTPGDREVVASTVVKAAQTPGRGSAPLERVAASGFFDLDGDTIASIDQLAVSGTSLVLRGTTADGTAKVWQLAGSQLVPLATEGNAAPSGASMFELFDQPAIRGWQVLLRASTPEATGGLRESVWLSRACGLEPLGERFGAGSHFVAGTGFFGGDPVAALQDDGVPSRGELLRWTAAGPERLADLPVSLRASPDTLAFVPRNTPGLTILALGIDGKLRTVLDPSTPLPDGIVLDVGAGVRYGAGSSRVAVSLVDPASTAHLLLFDLDSGGVARVVSDGDPSPTGTAFTVLGQDPAIDDQGRIYFVAATGGLPQIWRWTEGQLELMVSGEQLVDGAPIGDITLAGIGEGRLAFRGLDSNGTHITFGAYVLEVDRDQIFGDGFESGDSSAWSAAVP